jgi:uncharacterized protein (TIGR02246 family)
MTQQPAPVTTGNDAQLRALFSRMCQAWTDGDARAYGDCFTSDVDYVSYDGYRTRGREPMVESHDKLFRGVLYGSALVGEVESIRYLGDDVALVHGTGSVQVAWRSRLPQRRLTRNTIVAVRVPDDGWRFTAIHNGRVRPVGVPEPHSAVSKVARFFVRAGGVLGLGRARSLARPATMSTSA